MQRKRCLQYDENNFPSKVMFVCFVRLRICIATFTHSQFKNFLLVFLGGGREKDLILYFFNYIEMDQ